MKKLIMAFCILTIILCSCSSEPEVQPSAKAISVATQAISVTDQYLDGSVDYKSAYNKLSELDDQMSYADDLEYNDPDSHISTWVSLLNTSLLLEGSGGTAESYDKIIENRNKLAELIGAETR